MQTLNLTETHVVNKDGKTILLDQPKYNLSSEKFAKDNDFMQCCKCKNYFDSICQFGNYHPLYEKYGEKEFCVECFNNVNKG